MATSYKVNNEGAGSNLLLTFEVDTTANKDFTWTDIDSNLTAAAMSGNNTVGMGSTGSRLIGKVISVSDDLVSGTAVPQLCTVQVTGVARFLYSGTAPTVGNKVECDGTGKVRKAVTLTDVPAGGTAQRGMVIAVDTTNTTCDVLLDA
ncbi:MAG: hypothetical protein KDB65_09960 [Calditrichaeota bacterium]|nr:hypothetical protein [Calditrichota bacterium]MCB9369517.1 hypothetical protein [Calditrichota bacterium]